MIEPKQRKSAQSTMRSLVFLIAAFAIILGCAARFDHLGSRLLWQDEAFSMLRITGHTEAGLYGAFDGRVKPVATFLALNKLSPHLGLGATFASLREEPQRGPVFYGAARIWAGFVGDGTPGNAGAAGAARTSRGRPRVRSRARAFTRRRATACRARRTLADRDTFRTADT